MSFTPEAAEAIRLLHQSQTIYSLYDATTDVKSYAKIVHSMSVGMNALLENVGALADETSYKFLWNARASIEGSRISAGLSDFVVPPSTSVSTFRKIFPDSNNYLLRWSRHLGLKKTKALASSLKYRGKAHLLTMYACILMDARIRQYPANLFRQRRVRKMSAKRKRLNRSPHGHEGHPCVVVKAAMDELDL